MGVERDVCLARIGTEEEIYDRQSRQGSGVTLSCNHVPHTSAGACKFALDPVAGVRTVFGSRPQQLSQKRRQDRTKPKQGAEKVLVRHASGNNVPIWTGGIRCRARSTAIWLAWPSVSLRLARARSTQDNAIGTILPHVSGVLCGSPSKCRRVGCRY